MADLPINAHAALPTAAAGFCNCWPPCDKHPGTLVHCHHGDGIGERPQIAHSWTPETRSAYEAGREKGRAEERARLQRDHEQRMGPLHFVCCFNEVNQRDDFPATGAGGGGITMSETEQDAAEGTDAQDDTAAAEAAASPAADEDSE